MMRRFMATVALAAAMVGGAQASPVPADYVYNYSGATGYKAADFGGYVSTLGVSYQLYGGLNGTGALLGTLAEDGVQTSTFDNITLGANYADFADGTFSILWHADNIGAVAGVSSQSDVVMKVFDFRTQYKAGISVGQNCRDTPSLCNTGAGTGGNALPEPGTLPLLALAGLALMAARRRPAQRAASPANAV